MASVSTFIDEPIIFKFDNYVCSYQYTLQFDISLNELDVQPRLQGHEKGRILGREISAKKFRNSLMNMDHI